MKRHATICSLATLLVSGSILLGACSKSKPPEESKPAEQPANEMQSNPNQMQTPPAEATAAVSYVCPMHPEVTSTEAGKCSKCGMDLVQAAAASTPDSAAAQSAPH